MQMTENFALGMAKEAMLLSREDKSKFDEHSFKKIFRFVRPGDKLKERTIRPKSDYPILKKTEEHEPAKKGQIFEPKGGKFSVSEYTLELSVSAMAAHHDQDGETKNLAAELKKLEGETYQAYCEYLLNRAFDTSLVGLDGKPLCAVDHPLRCGGVNANRFVDAHELTADNVALAIAGMTTNKNEQGNIKSKTPKYLFTGPYLMAKASEICNTLNKAHTANHADNFVKRMGIEPLIFPGLESPTQWGLACPPNENGLIIYETMKIDVQTDKHITNRNYIFVVTMIFDIGWMDHRGIWIDPGQ